MVSLTSSLSKPRDAEVIIPFATPRDKLSPTTAVRSTLVASSLNRVREHGHLEAYTALLDPQWHDVIFHAVAGVWLPIAAGLAHYRACDDLNLPAAEQLDIGREVGDRIQGTFLGSMVRAAKGVGVTPWGAMAYSGRLYSRLFDGGGISVTKVGPKEARVEIAQNVLTGVGYFRSGLRGLYQVAIELFCAKAYVVDAARATSHDSCTMKISWV